MRLFRDRNSLYFSAGPVLNKCLEVGYQFRTPATRGNGFDVSLRFNTRGDHAGFKSWFELFGLLVEFTVHDRRHWNYATDTWLRSSDERPDFEPSLLNDYVPETGDDE
jgi:hypothetical protein